jgi:hypothetical protein
MSKYKPKEKLPPFIAIFRHTTKTPAWRALSVGARATFFFLQSNHNTKAQNAVFVSARDGARELGGVSKNNVPRWLRELEHYGFIVKIQGAHLGLDGKGKAARYRLTDRYYAGKAPTYDFQNWDGVLFSPKRTISKAEIDRLNGLRRKRNPVLRSGTPCPTVEDIRAEPENTQTGNKCPTVEDIRDDGGCPTVKDITSFTSSLPIPKLVWSAPEVTEVVGAEAQMLLEASKLWKLPPIAQHNQRAENFGLKLRSNRPQLVGSGLRGALH